MRNEKYKKLVDLIVFTMLGTIMFLSKLLMEALPNFHLLGMLITAFTIRYRKDALKPIYIFVLISGLFYGFAAWWVPYLYIWAVLWAMVMILPKSMKSQIAVPIYMIVSGLHGLLYGILYSPAYSLMFGLNFKQTVAWVLSGTVFDVTHAIGNIITAILVLPTVNALKRFHKY